EGRPATTDGMRGSRPIAGASSPPSADGRGRSANQRAPVDAAPRPLTAGWAADEAGERLARQPHRRHEPLAEVDEWHRRAGLAPFALDDDGALAPGRGREQGPAALGPRHLPRGGPGRPEQRLASRALRHWFPISVTVGHD